MKLYHYSKSRSARVLWLLEELGIDYQCEDLPFDRNAFHSVDYLELESYGRLPMLVDDAVTMHQSVAIVQYLLNRYGDGRLEPVRSSVDYGRFLEWLHFGESTMMGPVSQVIEHSMLLPESERRAPVVARGKRALGFFAKRIENELEHQTYLIDDDFTAADIVVGYGLFLAEYCGAFPADLPCLQAYYDRLKSRPAFRTATR